MAMSGSTQEQVQPRTTVPKEEASNSDDPIQTLKNEILNTGANQYKVLDLIGRGTFGYVFKCSQNGSEQAMAIKLLKNDTEKKFRCNEQEVIIVKKLTQLKAHEHNIVRCYNTFHHKNYTCLVFDLLEQDLAKFLKTKFMSLKEIRPIIQQILSALLKLEQLGVIHTDLKPQNIMLVDSVHQPWRVKLIDLGCAFFAYNANRRSYVQTLYYRAPENLLGLPFNQAIDMWSLGCVMAELFLAWPLYPGRTPYYQLSYICDTQGLPPQEMLMFGLRTYKYFIRMPNPSTQWRLKTVEECQAGPELKGKRKYRFLCLDCIIGAGVVPVKVGNEENPADELTDRLEFISLLKRLLEMDPNRRIRPHAALCHPFVTLAHLIRPNASKYVKESAKIMKNCNQ